MPAGTSSPQPFRRIAGRYRRVNRFISFGLDAVWRQSVVRSLLLKPGERLLDVGSGAGELIEFVEGRGIVKIGIDPERAMLMTSRVPFHRVQARAEELPFRPGSFDAVVSAFALRNLSDRQAAIGEMDRVLGAGGRGALTDFSPPKGGLWGGLMRLYLQIILPHWGGLLSGDREAYRYLSRTIFAFPSPEAIVREIASQQLDDVRFRRLTGVVAVLYTFRKRR